MADFREELHVERCKKNDGSPSFIPCYDWCHTKTDLADNTVEIIDFGLYDTIDVICKQIVDFESTEQSIKLGIRAFLESDRYYSEDEY